MPGGILERAVVRFCVKVVLENSAKLGSFRPSSSQVEVGGAKMGELIPLGDLNVTLQHLEKRTDPSRWCRSLELAAKPEVGVALNFASRRHYWPSQLKFSMSS